MNKIVETLGVVVEDARFEFKDKMQATVVDASHVAMIDMKVDAAAFDTWEIEENDLALELRKVKELISLGGADGPKWRTPRTRCPHAQPRQD